MPRCGSEETMGYYEVGASGASRRMQQFDREPSLDSKWTPARHPGSTEIALSLLINCGGQGSLWRALHAISPVAGVYLNPRLELAQHLSS